MKSPVFGVSKLGCTATDVRWLEVARGLKFLIALCSQNKGAYQFFCIYIQKAGFLLTWLKYEQGSEKY